MDAYQTLKIEINGIKDVILDYTSDGNINNILKQMDKALENDDLDVVRYCLENINNWYNFNIDRICSNQFVDNSDAHIRNKKLIEQLQSELKDYQLPDNDIYGNMDVKNSAKSTPTIFLSHCSKDKKFGDALEKLITGLGVPNQQLVYTSHPLHKIPLDVDIYEYLCNNFNGNVFVIILWSNSYLESPACLNEMGAAWVTKKDYTSFYTPDFSFDNPKYHECAVDTRKMGIRLNGDEHCKASMIEFKKKILELFNLKIEENKWMYLLDNFISDIQN